MPNIISGNTAYNASMDFGSVQYDYDYGDLGDMRPGKSDLHKLIVTEVMT